MLRKISRRIKRAFDKKNKKAFIPEETLTLNKKDQFIYIGPVLEKMKNTISVINYINRNRLYKLNENRFVWLSTIEMTAPITLTLLEAIKKDRCNIIINYEFNSDNFFNPFAVIEKKIWCTYGK